MLHVFFLSSLDSVRRVNTDDRTARCAAFSKSISGKTSSFRANTACARKMFEKSFSTLRAERTCGEQPE
ncbi:hypothetical protein A9R05_26300 [Burkholderia sp. KK1]|nr:hypothetical protein A9R05_26300 [Burkholderia sp. KK1]